MVEPSFVGSHDSLSLFVPSYTSYFARDWLWKLAIDPSAEWTVSSGWTSSRVHSGQFGVKLCMGHFDLWYYNVNQRCCLEPHPKDNESNFYFDLKAAVLKDLQTELCRAMALYAYPELRELGPLDMGKEVDQVLDKLPPPAQANLRVVEKFILMATEW